MKIETQLNGRSRRTQGHLGLTHALTRLPVEQAVRILQRHPAVALAEPNWIYTHQVLANGRIYRPSFPMH